MAADLSHGTPWRATSVATPLGPLVVAVGAAGVVAADLGRAFDEAVGAWEHRFDVAIRRDDRGLADLRAEARAYFGGDKGALGTPVDLAPSGTDFTRRVYEATIGIAPGELRTYGDVAAAAGSPKAWRAAGRALRACPVELWIPCHRVVPAGPGLGSYGGHPEVREFLLRLEGSFPRAGGAGRSRVRAGR